MHRRQQQLTQGLHGILHGVHENDAGIVEDGVHSLDELHVDVRVHDELRLHGNDRKRQADEYRQGETATRAIVPLYCHATR